MPKLDTTIDNLELKTNKVIGNIPSSSWTDTQYPSAKTLYNAYNNLTNMINLVHPVGSVITTSTNTNPAETLGGTWELVDKTFKEGYITLTASDWTPGTLSYTNADLINYSSVFLSGHHISLRLSLQVTSEFSDAGKELGKLALSSCGVTELPFAIFNDVAISDPGDCLLCYYISQNGIISLQDVYSLTTSPAHKFSPSDSSTFYIEAITPIKYENMLDDFCDKFYWKRTA